MIDAAGVRVGAAALACAAALGSAVAAAATSAAAPNPDRYGGIPSWLPTPKVPVGRVVTASAARPWLAIQGDTVRVRLAHGGVTAIVSGPAVPEEGHFPLPKTSRCTFTMTMAHASGRVPISPSAFTIVDEQGHIHHPRLVDRAGGAPASAVANGRTVTFIVRDTLPTGNGRLRWAPAGGRPLVSWDFDVEID